MKLKFFLSVLLISLAVSVSAQSVRALGKPFIKNYSSTQYNAHNRNFDIVCDTTGRVYVANFEGLLIYDGVHWKTIHTPKITRVNALYRSPSGRIWFGGHDFLGYVTGKWGNEVEYISSDEDTKQTFGEVNHIFEQGNTLCFSTSDGHTYQVNGTKITEQKLKNVPETGHVQVKIADLDKVFATTANQGLKVSDVKGNIQYLLTTDDGLCSNSINAITYDGKGSVWGATDNGIFLVSSSDVFTHFSESDGLIGQVTSIYQNEKHLYVGTLQGLYFLKENGRFEKVPGIDQACWQLMDDGHGQILAASADGLFLCGNSVRRLTSKHTLCVIIENPGSYLTGELDGIYRISAAGAETKLGDMTNAIKLERDAQGGILATTLYDGNFYKAASSDQFVKKSGSGKLMLNYKDGKGVLWTSGSNGLGLNGKGLPEGFEKWLKPFDALTVQTMYVYNTIAWIGGTFGVVRMDLQRCWKGHPFLPKLYVRSFEKDGENITVTAANDKEDVLGQTLYSYRLHKNDRWSRWSEDNNLNFQNLAYGSYELTVRSMDSYGNIAETDAVQFEIPYPIYLRWYAFVLYLVLLQISINTYLHFRTKRLRRQQQQLEKLVDERTQELKDAQKQILRQEKEATVGKLTKGLIDRILNPMNYINNFSHMSIGLTKDLTEDLEDEEERMTPDNYEDCLDVLDMMKTNLEKIEQHGLSTTRILKAMEEMLKERNTNLVPTNLTALLQQNVEMLRKYYEKDIQEMQIEIQWEKPVGEILANLVPEGMSKTVMSMLGNSIYAIRKKKEKDLANTYHPQLRLTLAKEEQNVRIGLYDNGIGIEQKIIGNVFDPFFTTKPTGDAPGVGLYLSQQIIQDFGGNITVESEKDQYTEFTIIIPI